MYSKDSFIYDEVCGFTAEAGRWVGVKHGVFCAHEGEGTSGFALVKSFIYKDKVFLKNAMPKYKEFYDNDAALPSIKNNISDTPQKNEDKILDYLKNSVCYVATSHRIEDVFDPEKTVFDGTHYTDGKFEWTDSLIYYVENYHLRLDEGFAAAIEKNNFKVPQIDLESLIIGYEWELR
ncbi:MAG: hypothetical protein IJR59_07950 [Firmicutes bacterium]|nr:hypothetical protein [Bacillota bacterium]